LKVLRANEFGIIVESNRGFDVGEEMTIGFHVSNGDEGSSFISAESLVVESERSVFCRGRIHHRVTLLFSNIATADRERLIALSKSVPMASRVRSMGLN
jgi:hypothetical protein